MDDMRSLNPEELDNISGGLIVEDGHQLWVVRQDGTVYAPAPDRNTAVKYANQINVSTTILTRDEYKARFHRDLVW